MTRGSRGLLAVTAVVALVLTAVPAAGAFAAQTDRPEADNTVTRIGVETDGDATWTVQVRTRLETDEERRAFESFQERFRENRSEYLDPFRQNVRAAVANADNETARNMTAENFTAATDVQAVPRRWGVVTYEFRWTAFARTEGDRVFVGDVFESGFFIGENDSLQIVAPADYDVARTEPPADSVRDDAAVWDGRTDFADGRPTVVFEPEPTATPAPTDSDPTTEADESTTTPTTDETGTTAPPETATGDLPLWLTVLVALGMVVAVGAVATRRDELDGTLAARLPWTGGDGGASVAGGDDAGAGAVAAPAPTSDEDRLLRIVEERGGELKQSDLVDEVEWSKSKVSRLLSDLESEGAVDRVQIGREKLVRRSGED